MVQGSQSGFSFLAADLLSVAGERVAPAGTPTSPPKTRVRGFRPCSSGRLSRRGPPSPLFTPGSRACAYKTASGRRKWLNRDPIQEEGGINLYNFVSNRPVDWIDDLGEQIMRPGPRPGRPPYRYPNGRPYIMPPPPPPPSRPYDRWPFTRPPSKCITISIPGSNRSGLEAVEEGVIQEHWTIVKLPSQSFCAPLPNSQSCVNSPPDLGLTTPPPPRRRVFARKDGPPIIVRPGTVIIWY